MKPAAHNGLSLGSSPSAPTTLMEVILDFPEYVKPVGMKSRIPFLTQTYAGHPSKYPFPSSVMMEHYRTLKGILAKYNLEFKMLGAHTYNGNGSYTARWANANATSKLTKFIAFAGDPWNSPFVWYKYEGFTAGGGHNHVYLDGQKMKLSDFYLLEDDELDVMLRRSITVSSK